MAMGLFRERLSHVDAAWLRMESSTNLMMVTAVQTFEGPLDEAAMMAAIAGLARHRRFRQKVVRNPLGRFAWEEDPHFDIRSHVHKVALPRPGGHRELEAFVSDRMSTPLDRAKPLWQVDLIDGVGSGSAVVERIHHAVADGIALVRIFLGLTDEGSDAAPMEVGLPKISTPKAPLAWAKHELGQAVTLAKLLALPRDPSTILRGPLEAQRRAAWSSPIGLAAVREAASARDATLNDVLVAAVAGALRGYLKSRGALREKSEIRALVPVYLRGTDGDTGNHFGLVFVSLPIDVADMEARIRNVKLQMDAIKVSPAASVAFGVLGAMGIASASIERMGVNVFTKKATLLLTSVPGPSARVHLVGRRVESMMVWAPTSGSLGLGLSLLSYADEVRLGVSADASLVPDPDAIVAEFEREMRKLHSP